jgi:hypothetical protein
MTRIVQPAAMPPDMLVGGAFPLLCGESLLDFIVFAALLGRA